MMTQDDKRNYRINMANGDYFVMCGDNNFNAGNYKDARIDYSNALCAYRKAESVAYLADDLTAKINASAIKVATEEKLAKVTQRYSTDSTPAFTK